MIGERTNATRGGYAVVVVAATLATLIGCAAYTVPPPTATSVPATPPSTVVTPSPPASLSPAPAVVDSAPSPEALEVLSSIPDPLTAGERVPPAEPSAFPPYRGADSTARVDAPSGSVPVPEPTLPLGKRRSIIAPDTSVATSNPLLPSDSPESATPTDSARARSAGPDTSTLPAAPAQTPPAQGDPAPPAPAAAEPDSCWRVQIAAPSVRDEADGMRVAGESQLLVPMVIEVEAGRYKVRSAPCMDRAASVALRDRARAAGFEGAFPVLRVKR